MQFRMTSCCIRLRTTTSLVDLVVSQLGDAQLCADLEAGTGNATLKLLERHSSRQVWAIESNEMMLQYLKQKVGTHLGRLTAIKDDVVRTGCPAVSERLLRCGDHDQRSICRSRSFGVPAPSMPDLEAGGNAGAVHSAPGYRCEKGFEETA